MPNKELASGRRIQAAQRELEAIQLRLAGATYAQIAKGVGYRGPSGAQAAVKRGLKRIRGKAEEIAEVLRGVEDSRYDRILRAIDPQVRQGHLGAVDRALRVSKARRELWGLDAPTKTDVTSGGQTIHVIGGVNLDEL